MEKRSGHQFNELVNTVPLWNYTQRDALILLSFNCPQEVSTWLLHRYFTCSKVNSNKFFFFLTTSFLVEISTLLFSFIHSTFTQAFTKCQLHANCCRYWDKRHSPYLHAVVRWGGDCPPLAICLQQLPE